MTKKNWSINVTTRNPSRLRDILEILAEFEGQEFDERVQAKFIDRVVESGLYEPIRGIKDKPLRGRTWAGIFNTLGFAIAWKGYGKVLITPAGKALLQGHIAEQEIFLRQLLKWQLPNPSPTARGFGDYDIIPFVATLHLLKKVDGVNKQEFNLFIPTLTRIENLDRQAQIILNFRKQLETITDKNSARKFLKMYIRKFVLNTYKEELRRELQKNPLQNEKRKRDIINDFVRRKSNNLKDYGDTILRYFSYTGIITLHGRGLKITISPAKKVEADRIMEAFDGGALLFQGVKQKDRLSKWYDYLGSATEPSLPYKTKEDYLTMAKNVYAEIQQLIPEINRIHPNFRLPPVNFEDLKRKEVSELYSTVEFLREKKKQMLQLIESYRIRSLEEFSRIIDTLEAIDRGDPDIPDRALWLEWYVYLALKAINDEEVIKPNFPLDENNQPRSVAVAGKPDIEAYYKDFVLVPEVTTNRTRIQAYIEGVPVARHIVNVIVKELKEGKGRPVYGLFLAPLIHYDTRNIFWVFATSGLEKAKGIVFPLTIEQFIRILRAIEKAWKEAKLINSGQIKELIIKLEDRLNKAKDPAEWYKSIPLIIDRWVETILS